MSIWRNIAIALKMQGRGEQRAQTYANAWLLQFGFLLKAPLEKTGALARPGVSATDPDSTYAIKGARTSRRGKVLVEHRCIA